MKATAIACTALTVATAAPSATADVLENLAFGRGVSVAAGSASGASPSTLTDGVFRPAGTQWQNGTVWWSGASTVLQVDLDGPVELRGAIVQADNNDTYRLWYRDLVTGTYSELWTVAAVGGAGMRTRPDPADSPIPFAAYRAANAGGGAGRGTYVIDLSKRRWHAERL